MKFKIFEEDTRYKLEKELNDFAKNNEIQHISLTALWPVIHLLCSCCVLRKSIKGTRQIKKSRIAPTDSINPTHLLYHKRSGLT